MGWKRNRVTWRDDFSRVSWDNFERLLADHFREAGYVVEHCGTGHTGSRYDGGVDLVLRRDGETVLVQVKHWNAAQVPHNDVHQLLGLVETRGATRAILITSGEFTTYAREAAERSPRIELIDGSALRRLLDPRLIPVAAPQPPEPSPGVSHADLMEWRPVVEKSVDAVIDVMSGRRPGRRRKSFGEELASGLARGLFGLVVLLIVLWFVRGQVENAFQLLPHGPRTERASVPASSPPPRTPAGSRQAVSPSAPPQGFQRMSEEELAEWERKNRESMEIIKRTTPELE